MSDSVISFCRQRAVSVFQKGAGALEALLYPPKCYTCGAYLASACDSLSTLETLFCDSCLAAGVHPVEPPFCTQCGIPFPNSAGLDHLCGTCLKTPLKLEKVRGALEYRGIIKNAIPLFKYHGKLSAASVFESLVFETFVRYYQTCRIDRIMPIPLHKQKLRERGFNQAYFLVRRFKKRYQNRFGSTPAWEIDTKSLVRVRATSPQTGFDIEDRKKNLKNAFRVSQKDKVAQKHILLVDDVLTTGSTCNEAARELLKHNAATVSALVLARA